MYRDFNQRLGQTGAGLPYSEINPGLQIYNLIGMSLVIHLFLELMPYEDDMKEEFPYWERLHGYWRTLPNFNPLTVTSEPDQDLENGAVNLFQRGNSPPANAHALLDLGFEGKPPAHPVFSVVDSLNLEELAEFEADADADGEDENVGDDEVHIFLCFQALKYSPLISLRGLMLGLLLLHL